MSEEKIKVVIKRVGEPPEETLIYPTLETMQELVNGYIEMPSMPGYSDVKFVCNEEGKVIGLPSNFFFDSDIICGNVVAVRTDDEGETVSLTEEQIDLVKKYFNENAIEVTSEKKELSEEKRNSWEAAFFDSITPQFAIYQMKNEEDYKFRSLEEIEAAGQKVTRDKYNFIYADYTFNDYSLERVFDIFNNHIPQDFNGHSLSMSDIVVSNIGGELSAFYCDRYDFKPIPDFITYKEKLCIYANNDFESYKYFELFKSKEEIFANAFKTNFYSTMCNFLNDTDGNGLDERTCQILCQEGSNIITLLYDYISNEIISVNDYDQMRSFVKQFCCASSPEFKKRLSNSEME